MTSKRKKKKSAAEKKHERFWREREEDEFKKKIDHLAAWIDRFSASLVHLRIAVSDLKPRKRARKKPR